MPAHPQRADSYRIPISLARLVKRAHWLLVSHLEPILGSHGLTFTQWSVLAHLYDCPDLSPTALRAKVGHDSGALTRVIAQLQSRELLRRERSHEDGRSITLSLTNAGVRVVESTAPAVARCVNEALTGFSLGDTSVLTHLLDALTQVLESSLETERRRRLADAVAARWA